MPNSPLQIITRLLPPLLALGTLSNAVDITFVADCSSNAAIVCTNIPEGRCCENPNAMFNWFVKVTNYPASPAFFAQAFLERDDRQPGCGANCNAVPGTEDSICMGCEDKDGADMIGGAAWMERRGKRVGMNKHGKYGKKGKNEGGDMGCLKPDRAMVGGKWFYVNYHVEEKHSEMLIDLAMVGAGYHEVPEELRQYELVLQEFLG